MLEYNGLFETHITVTPQDSRGLEHFRETCAALSVKPILIELERGASPLQPMTQAHMHGTLSETRTVARQTAAKLENAGFTVTRVKIEAAPDNVGLPETDAEATALPATNYYEYHWKMVLDPGRAGELRALCEQHRAHLSLNAFKRREDGLEERFITLRCTGVGRLSSDERFHTIHNALHQNGFFPAKWVCEYCVYDTNTALDEDWLEI